MGVKQDEVFDVVARDSVMSAMEGYNATIFAYGQTGSGKTFTITGGAERYVDRGIIPRSLSHIFNEISKRADAQYKVHISYLEIYNGNGYDLLDPDHETTALEDMPQVVLREDDGGNVHIKLEHALCGERRRRPQLIVWGDTNRAIAETPMNMVVALALRVHNIIEARQPGSDVIRRSKLHLVDLAGSERTHKQMPQGRFLERRTTSTCPQLPRAGYHRAARKSDQGRQHIPYRNSLITSILRDSLGGNCKTSMANISADMSNIGESISTCRFAQRVGLIKNSATSTSKWTPLW